MEIPEYIAVISTVISLVGLAVVLMELRRNRHQSKTNALIKIYDISRQLLSMSFSHPELFALIENNDSNNNPTERRYLQLCFNQMTLIYQLH